MSAFKITNITSLTTQTRGFFLDLGDEFKNKAIPVGKQIVLEAKQKGLLPACVLAWEEKKWVKITDLDAADSDDAAATFGELTPKSVNPINEVNNDDDFNEEPDLSEAVPANLSGLENTKPINGNTSQMAKVSEAAAEERYATDMSPIPGDKPKNVDDTDKFTIRAPKTTHPGAVIGRGK